MEKTERLLDLVALLLDAREPVSFADLRELFPEDYGGSRDAAERKLERDKADLLELGVPIEYVDPDRVDERDLGGYRIDRKSYFLPDPKLMPEEAAALYAAGAAALATRDFPFAQDLRHALRKISLAGDTQAVGSAAARRLLVVRPGDPQRAGKLRALGEAVARRKRVHIVYQAPPAFDGKPGARTERDVDPWGLGFRGGAWRLVGFCHLRTDQRVFLVDRIESVTLNPAKPNTPDFDPPADFDAGTAAGRSSKPWQWAHHPPEEVRLRFAPGSEAIAERLFDAPAGNLTVTNLDGLVPQILSLGDRVWIESPAAAREKVRGALLRIRERVDQPVHPPAEPIAAPAASAHARPQPDAAEEGKRERLRRLLLIVPAARRRPGIRLADLAGELGLSPEELREDIDLLALVGRPPFSPDDLIDICVDERERVSVSLDQSFSRPPQLTPLEALALASAAQEVAPADPAVTSGLAKLTETLPAQARRLYAQLAGRVAMATPTPSGAGLTLARLRAAAERHREVALDYDKEGRGAVGERIFQPHGVIDHGGVWYAIGHDLGRGAERTFRLDRILSVRETGRSFPDPGPLDPARFEREQLFFPSGREEAVTLRFSQAAGAWALQRYGSRARQLEDGRVDVSIESAGTGYAVQLALSLAGEAEIAAPAHAREALRDEVARALRRGEEAR
ncbi:MAG TPA: WYL domain-containing protein [Myxococcales bacterium]|nr:WYL domain-containing protein [Myxococcales bacterium]